MIAVVVVGHGRIASELVNVVEKILRSKQEFFEAINVKLGESQDIIGKNLNRIMLMAEIDGVLVLSDIHGSFSHACAYIGENQDSIAVVTGVNLNMILKVMGHRKDSSLKELVTVACEGGKSGIMDVCGKTSKKD